jgi:hypothetical protein
MSNPGYMVRFRARIVVRSVPGSPGFDGIQNGFRSSVLVAGSYHPSQVMECDGPIAPNEKGSVTIEMISTKTNAILAGSHFELRSGSTIAAEGRVESIESTRSLSS